MGVRVYTDPLEWHALTTTHPSSSSSSSAAAAASAAAASSSVAPSSPVAASNVVYLRDGCASGLKIVHVHHDYQARVVLTRSLSLPPPLFHSFVFETSDNNNRRQCVQCSCVYVCVYVCTCVRSLTLSRCDASVGSCFDSKCCVLIVGPIPQLFAQDSVGQNSNDSSSGVGTGVGTAPGTPNSLAMRPTPSPTGSSGSRSMSPAVGK